MVSCSLEHHERIKAIINNPIIRFLIRSTPQLFSKKYSTFYSCLNSSITSLTYFSPPSGVVTVLKIHVEYPPCSIASFVGKYPRLSLVSCISTTGFSGNLTTIFFAYSVKSSKGAVKNNNFPILNTLIFAP